MQCHSQLREIASKITLAAACVTLLLSPARAEEENLVQDPAFETVGMVGQGAVWMLSQPDLKTEPASSEHGPAVRLTATEQPDQLLQHFRLPRDGDYEMRVMVKGSPETRYRVYYEWVDSNGGFHSVMAGGLRPVTDGWNPGTDGWEELVREFHFEGEPTAAYLVLQIQGSGEVEFSKPELTAVGN